MKRWILFLFAATIASAQITRLPNEFQITERFLSLTSTFDVSTDVLTFATATKRFFSLTTCFDLIDGNNVPQASANSRFFSWGTVADVTDSKGDKIGWIEEEIFRLIPWSEYRVFNAFNQIVAVARMNFWGTDFELYPPNDPSHIYATINRPFIRCFRDNWTVKILDESAFETGAIDPRLLVMLAIYQTDKDNRDRMRNQIINQLSNDQNYNDFYRFEY
jgi:hypothetical protein